MPGDAGNGRSQLVRDIDDKLASSLLGLFRSFFLPGRQRSCLFQSQRRIAHAKHQACELSLYQSEAVEQMKRDEAQAKPRCREPQVALQAFFSAGISLDGDNEREKWRGEQPYDEGDR